MKKIIMTIMLAAAGTMIVEAQSYRDYNPNDFRRYNYRSNSGYNYNANAASYDFRYLPRNTRRRLNKLEYRLADERRCALQDGYISRREARRIGRIQNDIDALLFDYRRNNNRRNRGRVSCP